MTTLEIINIDIKTLINNNSSNILILNYAKSWEGNGHYLIPLTTC